MINFVMFLLSLYRKIAVYFIRPSCRFYPSCSHYTEAALVRHGMITGCFLAFKRIIRCNQLFSGGFDPVPE